VDPLNRVSRPAVVLTPLHLDPPQVYGCSGRPGSGVAGSGKRATSFFVQGKTRSAQLAQVSIRAAGKDWQPLYFRVPAARMPEACKI
jgi:hypothetical protein